MPSARSGPGPGPARCFPVFPKVDTPYGQAPLGLEGSGASRRPGSIVHVLRTERWVQPTERAGSEGNFICRCLGQRKPYNRPNGRNAIPLWWLAPPPFRPAGKRVTGFVGRLQLPYESSSFATSAVRLVNQKEGPFMGRLRAYFDQLAHPMQDVHSGTITRAYCRAIYEENASRCFILPPACGGSPAQPDRGRRAQRANQQNAYHAIWY